MTLELFAPCPRGLEPVLLEELRALGAQELAEHRAGVAFRGSLELAYRACLWSRVASRVLLTLSRFSAPDPDALYAGIHAVPWAEHLSPRGTLSVHADCHNNAAIAHSGFAALRVKDAVVDRLRAASGARPSVDPADPDLRLRLFLNGERATLYLDLAGEALHRRAYRFAGGRAPLKENLAAGLLLLAGWPALAAEGRPLLDPMCGSGTFLVEAALIAADIAPGLQREAFAFERWRGHDAATWARLQGEARERAGQGRQAASPPIVGYDADAAAIARARDNVRRAGRGRLVRLEQRELSRAGDRVPDEAGLLLVNPPYGRRIGEVEALIPLYAALGDLLKQRFGGWSAHVLTGNRELAGYIGLRAARRHVVYNGSIECRLLAYPIEARREPAPGAATATDFENRLRKNLRHISRWARRVGVTCYRVYDADIPEYAVAVDRYEGWVHVQEYAPPASVDPSDARRRLRRVLAVIPDLLGVGAQDVFLKVRRRQRRGAQYEKIASSGDLRQVHEGPHRLLVNLRDYLDTGLFLEQRQTRALIAELAPGRRFLNLFCYTAAATVYAAAGGARATTSVDLSATYLDWARRNLALNGFTGARHALLRTDCSAWIEACRERFGLIYLNPPTFSRSKAMRGTLDVQRDHAWLIRAAAGLLEPDGVLLFATGARRFKLDPSALPGLAIEEISRACLPPDFSRRPHAHRVWRITRG